MILYPAFKDKWIREYLPGEHANRIVDSFKRFFERDYNKLPNRPRYRRSRSLRISERTATSPNAPLRPTETKLNSILKNLSTKARRLRILSSGGGRERRAFHGLRGWRTISYLFLRRRASSAAQTSKLFKPIKVGALDLQHRIVLAPLTRGRADALGVPASYAADYYSQRATPGGLLITEGTFVSLEASGRPFSPGIYSKEQIEAWKHVTDAVHAKGAFILCQLWALGRIAEPDLVPAVLSPGSQPFFEDDDITRKIPDKFTVMSEADIDDFLQSTSNDRTDQYGGSIENRIRFPLRVVNAVSDAIGPQRVGVRVSPFTRFQGMREAEPLSLFVPWAQAIVDAQPRIAYIHAIEPRADGSIDTPEHLRKVEDTLAPIREVATRAGVQFIVAGGYTPEKALQHTSETDDLVAFGRHFIPNPDLPARIKNGWLLTKYDRSVFYEVNEVGYSDYPVYNIETATA
ncbi:NADPH2 dehydrogenase [Fusarium oxysporum f. sp. melonis 26406]|uniref:NADPH2 dehydrogenase n=1 Tax=Fusarium oxysporum f. sp. melonis 26406 TaxID=1089452 RepID=W9Z8A0_FUSOX|nr:NADPH2 dehydrogenase [Fusarium oxysporum f. sp. melonis 26406]